MVAVGLSRLFKYGAKFLGHFVAVAVAGGVFVGGGAYFAATGGLNVLDPSFGALTTGRAIGGAILVLLGIVISLSGLFGLVHKLLADAAAVAISSERVASADSAAVAEAETGDEDEATADEAGSVNGDGSAVADDGSATPLDGADTTGTVTEEPATGRPIQEGATTNESDSTAEPTNASSGAAPASDGERTASGVDSPSEETVPETEGSAAATSASSDSVEPAPSDGRTRADSDDFVDESAADDDWTESKYATGTQPPEVDDASPERDTPDVSTRDTHEEREQSDDEQTEWTPPDPAEFERANEAKADSPTDSGPEAGGEDAGRADEAQSQADEEVRTWNDVQNASSGNGLEADETPTDVDRSASLGDDATAVSDVVDEMDADREPLAEDRPHFAGDDPGQSAGDEAPGSPAETVDDEAAIDERDDEDRTLADEGVSSFDVKGDDDPLGDRLSGGD